MQCHVLGVVVVPPLFVAWLVDVRGRRRRDERLRPAVGAGVGALAILAAGYLPLLAFELQHDFAETRAILAYLGGSGSSAASGALARIGIVGARSIAWPVSGLFTDRPLLATVAVIAACALAAIAVLSGRGIGRRAAAWLAGSVAWAIVALALFAPSLAVITPGLPNDHYHSFLDPLVLALLGAGIARVAGRATDAGEAASPGPVPAGRPLPPRGSASCSSPSPSSRGHPRRRPTAAGASPTRPRHGRSRRWPTDRPQPHSRSSGSRRSRTPTRCASRSSTAARRRSLPDQAAGDGTSSSSATRCSTTSSAPPAAARRRTRCWPRGGLRPRPPRPLRRGFAPRDLGLRRGAMTRPAALVDVPRLPDGNSSTPRAPYARF